MNKRSLVLYCIIALIILTIYGPFVLKGGFGPSDDLAHAYNSNSGFASKLSSSIISKSSASRPLYAVFHRINLFLFGDSPRPYIILQISIWLASVALLSRIVKLMLGRISALLFFLFGAMPIFSSAVIFSPYMVGNTFAIFFWALSLIFIHNFAVRGGRSNFWLSHLFLAMGLLSMEIILPLLLFNAQLPWIVKKHSNIQECSNMMQVRYRYFLPVIGMAILFFIFKVFITKMYSGNTGTYGLSVNTKSILQSMYYFIVLVFEIPSMLFETIPFLLNPRIVFVFALISIFFIYLIMFKSCDWISHYSSEEKRRALCFLNLVILGIICCSMIFFLSGYPAVTFGHYNKMMMPTHFLGAILLSWYFRKMLNNKWIISAIFFSTLWCASMIIQIDKFIDSWEIRKTVLSDCTEKLNNVELGKEPYLIASVPYFIKNNYNNEHVFWLSWDFSSGLKLFGSEKLSSAFPFCWQTLINPDYYVNHNINHHITKLPENVNLWYYKFDLEKSISTLRRIDNCADLEREFQRIVTNKVNYHPIIFRQRIRMKLKEWII